MAKINNTKPCSKCIEAIRPGTAVRGPLALWGSDLCWRHLQEQGKDEVNNWRRIVFENRENLEGANLREVDLSWEAYEKIGLQADFYFANFKGAKLQESNLRGINAGSADFTDAYLNKAHLEKTNLRGAIFKKSDLSEAHLRNADLRYAELMSAKLEKAYLENVNFYKAHLENADLRGAHLENADLINTNFKCANLEGAYLKKANLWETNFENANLWKADLKEASLSNTHFKNAYLAGANLENANGFADFKNAKLISASLKGAKLRGSGFKKAVLKLADLENADLSKVNLEKADLSEADFENANLSYADLKGANLLDIRYIKPYRLPEPAKNFILRFLIICRIKARFLYDVAFISLVLISLIFPFILKPISKWIPDLLVLPAFILKLFSQYLFVELGLILIPFIPFVLPLFWVWIFYKGEFKKGREIAEKYLKKLEKNEKKQWKINWLRRILHPTRWCGAVVDAVGRCDPLDLRYIKDQSWLEAKIEEAKKCWWKRFWMYLWGITCGYGTNIWLWIFWSAVIVLSFGATYWLGGDSLVQVLDQVARKSWDTYLYYSIVTFTTLGFGDVVPTSCAGEAIVAIEVFMGYLMLGGLISIFANLLARRA